MAQIALFVVVYHILVVTVALLIEQAQRASKFLPVLLALALLAGCETPAIKVTPMPDVAAVRVQNETTKKHIKTFTASNQKTRRHIEKSQESEAKADDKLQNVKKDLEELLKQ